MVYVTKCEYSINNGRLEMEDVSGNHYSIDVYAVEDEYADNMYQRSSLDYLLYNEGFLKAKNIHFYQFRRISSVCFHKTEDFQLYKTYK